MSVRSPKQLYFLYGAAILFPTIPLSTIQEANLQNGVLAGFALSLLGFFLTVWLIPLVKFYTLRKGLFGRDINKKGTPGGEIQIPESLGLACGVVFLICLVLEELLHFYDLTSILYPVSLKNLEQDGQGIDAWLVDYNAALAAICFMLFLGFVDDVLDVPWRVKLVLPNFAALPLLVAYSGGTGIAVPKPVVGIFGCIWSLLQMFKLDWVLSFLGVFYLPGYLELGLLYKVYMVMLVIFCTNSINILAGVNGLEAGQSFIISIAVLFHNLSALSGYPGITSAQRDGHLFSVFIMLPFAAVTAGLLWYNWYPSEVFVGDTYTYFAGISFACAGILGHFSETLLIFFIPQILNFVYSIPQLIGWVHCPRHRLPTFDKETGLLHPTPNWNLVNLFLQVLGPCTEQQLCVRLLVFQGLCCWLGLGLHTILGGIYK